MSWNPTQNPECPASDTNSVETLIIPRARDIGGFDVRRALPSPDRQMVGPFIFFDQMGPAEFIDEGGIDVRPHPAYRFGNSHVSLRRANLNTEIVSARIR